MPKTTMGKELTQAMGEAIKYMRGEKEGSITYEIKVPHKIDVRKIRQKTGLTRLRFAKRFGFRIKTVQHWEQGDRKPSGPARILLAILEKDPQVIDRCLGFHAPKRRGGAAKKTALR